jgi:signal transduction histidine kinase
MMLFGFLIIGFVFYYQRRQFKIELKQNEEKQQIELDFQKKMLENSVEVQENERRRLAKDLHDEVGAMLSVLKMGNNQLLKKTSDNETLKALAKNNHELIDESINKVRSISKDLLPQTLENFGLLPALEEFFGKLSRSSDIEFGFNVEAINKKERFNPKVELSLYRVIQELVSNAIKHSEAKKIHLTITSSGEKVTLIFEDNGLGFNRDQVLSDSKSGLGMRNIESRLSLIDAKLHIESEPNEGSKFIIELAKNSHE